MCVILISDGEILRSPVHSRVLQEWIRLSYANINSENENPQVFAFTLRLLALLVENEWQFMNIMETDIFSRLVQNILYMLPNITF